MSGCRCAAPARLPARDATLDVFRGLTIALMLVVNSPGNLAVTWPPLLHAHWHGFTVADFVFPAFLFAAGLSAWHALARRAGRPTTGVLIGIWRRAALLFALGVVMWHVPGFVASFFGPGPAAFLAELVPRVRIPGVLQRLAVCYGVGATLALLLPRRALVGVCGGLLAAHWALLVGYGQGPDPLALETNAARRLDLQVFGAAHLYRGERIDGVRVAFDPEGIVGTLPATASFLIGFLGAPWLCAAGSAGATWRRLLVVAALFVAALLWDRALGLPINKKLWTGSYTLFAAAWSLTALACARLAVERRPAHPGLRFLATFGRNPLLAYLLSAWLVVTLYTIPVPGDPARTGYGWLYGHTAAALAGDGPVASLLFALGCTLLVWALVRAAEWRGVFVRI